MMDRQFLPNQSPVLANSSEVGRPRSRDGLFTSGCR